MIALFFATLNECELIVEQLSEKSKILVRTVPFIKGKINGLEVILCISGIGKTNAAVASVVAFENFPINKAVISGIAGAYPSSGLNIGSIVVAEKEVFADEGLLIDCKDSFHSFIFINHEEFLLYVPDFMKNLPKGTFLTVSACTGNIERAKFLEKKFNAVCENMEGAAIAKVAQLYKIPCVEIRSISNFITNRTELLSSQEVKTSAQNVQRFILDHLPLFAEF